MVRETPPSKMHPYTKFGIPTPKNIGDLHRTRSGTDGLTDGRTDSAITICLQKILWGHKKTDKHAADFSKAVYIYVGA